MREEGDRGRPAEEGGHKPLKFSLNAETRAALAKVKKRQPVSKFIEEVVQPLARQFDPGPSSPLALEIIGKIRSERDMAFKSEDMEEVVALDYLLLRVKPALDPFVAMSEPEPNQQNEAGKEQDRDRTVVSSKAPRATEKEFSEEFEKAALGRLCYTLDYLVDEFESVFSQSKNIVDLKIVKVVRPKYVDLWDALKSAWLVSDEFGIESHRQFVHEVTEKRDTIARVLSKKYPKWLKEVERPPDARPGGIWLPDYLLLIEVDQTTEPYRANVVADMAPQLSELQRNLSSAQNLVNELKQKYPGLADILRLLARYDAFFRPGFKECREYEERNNRMRQSILERIAEESYSQPRRSSQ